MGATATARTRLLQADPGGGATVRWNLLIAGASRRDPLAAVSLYKSMQSSSELRPNDHTFPALLRSMAMQPDPLHLRHFHAHLLRLGLLRRHAAAALLRAYGELRLPCQSRRLFDEIPRLDHDPVLWTGLVSSLSENGRVSEAFAALSAMRSSVGIDPGAAAAVVSGAGELRQGQLLHAMAIKEGVDVADPRLASAFVHMYARLGGAAAAAVCFRAIPASSRVAACWNAVISGLAMNGDGSGAMALFKEMVAGGEVPNRVTLISVLKAAAELGSGEVAADVLAWLRPPASDVVMMTALVELQATSGEVGKAREIFDAVQGKNVVCWSAMIGGYEQNSMPEEAIRLFRLMMKEGEIRPNAVTFLSLISAGAAVGAAGLAGAIHKQAAVAGAGADDRVFSAMIGMYARSGELPLARRLFEERDRGRMSVAGWTAMIGAEGIHGGGRRALGLFSEMQARGFKPNEVTLVAVLSACGHAGLVEEGVSCFEAVRRGDFGVAANERHYACAVDLLGRAGKLEEAMSMVETMPVEADLPVWGSLLGACRIHGNVGIAKKVEGRMKGLLRDGWGSAGHLVLLANLYKQGGRRDEAVRVRAELMCSPLRKIPGRSFVAVGKVARGFTAGDASHEESELIYAELRELDVKVREMGYARKRRWDGREEEEGEEDGRFHSERLAMAFGIMISRRGGGAETGPMRIMKNLRVCEDCHEYTKAVGKVIGRELIVRDSRRFHHFKDGFCSCGDFW
ncbi:putative pentatricopeptide repeat-containing protein At3g11460, mitochondrial [Wolffia australiana]